MARRRFRGRIKNISGGTLHIKCLGITLADNQVYRIRDTVNPHTLFHATLEFDALILQGKIEIRTQRGRILTVGESATWIEHSWGLRDHYTIRMNSWITSAIVGSEVWMEDERGIAHDTIPLFVPQDVTIRLVMANLDVVEPTNRYVVKLFSNPHVAPVEIRRLVPIRPNSLTISVEPNRRLLVGRGFYGLKIERTQGTTDSTFTKARVALFAEPTPY